MTYRLRFLILLALLMVSVTPAFAKRTLLIFEIDEGFPDAILGRYRHDVEGMNRALGNIRTALVPLTTRYDVAVLVYPSQAYKTEDGPHQPLGRVEPSLLRLLEFFAKAGGPKIGVFLEAYSSGNQTEQNGEIDKRPTPLLGVGPNDHPRPGLSMDMQTFDELCTAFPGTFTGIRFHEVYGSDAVLRASSAGAVHGFLVDPEVIRSSIDLCHRRNLRLVWSDSAWLMRRPPSTGPAFLSSPSEPAYSASEPYKSLQDEAEAKLGSQICFSFANNNYHLTPNLEFLTAKVGPSAPGVTRPLASWMFFDQPYAEFPFKKRKQAQWGMSIQSWFWHEATNTLVGRYYPGGEMACPIEVLEAYVDKGLREGASVLQFEPSWYFFNEGLLLKPDEVKPDHSERLALTTLKKELLAAKHEWPSLDKLFDSDQQRYLENDAARPPKSFAKNLLVVDGDATESFSFRRQWRKPSVNPFLPSVLKDHREAYRFELQGDGVDDLLVVRGSTGHDLTVSFYNSSIGRYTSSLVIPWTTKDGTYVGIATGNLIAQVVGQGDPDEFVVVRTKGCQVYAKTWSSGDGYAFRYEPVEASLNMSALQGVGRLPVGSVLVGLRVDASLHANGTRSLDRLMTSTGNGIPIAVDREFTGKDSLVLRTPLGQSVGVRRGLYGRGFCLRSRILLNAK